MHMRDFSGIEGWQASLQYLEEFITKREITKRYPTTTGNVCDI